MEIGHRCPASREVVMRITIGAGVAGGIRYILIKEQTARMGKA
jgi:hypothetical protein